MNEPIETELESAVLLAGGVIPKILQERLHMTDEARLIARLHKISVKALILRLPHSGSILSPLMSAVRDDEALLES